MSTNKIRTPCLGLGPAQSRILMHHNSISSSHSRRASKSPGPSTGTCCCAFRMTLLCFCVMRAFCTLLGLNDIKVLATLSKVPESNGCESHCKCEHGPSKTVTFVSQKPLDESRIKPTPRSNWLCQPFAQLALQPILQSPFRFALSPGCAPQ